MNVQDLWLRLRALFRRDKVEQELGDELQFHIEMQTRKNVAAGMSADEARRQARLRFGRPEEACRDERRIDFIETLWQDARYSIRGFRRAPIFALGVIATIAVGLGVNTAVFTFFNAFVLRPYDVRDPYSLYTIYGRPDLKLANLDDLRQAEMPFSDVIATQYAYAHVKGRLVAGELVTGNYFEALGIRAVIGRTLTPEDTRIGAPVVVLSYDAWKAWFGGDPGVLGTRLSIRGSPIVVGVARDGLERFGYFWAPLGIPALRDPDQPENDVEIIGRLKPGMSKSQAQAGLSLWAARIPHGSAWLGSRASRVQMNLNGLLGLSPILTVFGLVLVMACANVTNMMLARAMTRQREIGIRLSLGAARRRLIRQLLTESILLAIPAALLGLVISRGLVEVAVRLATIVDRPLGNLPLPADWRVLGFMMAAGVGSAMLFGLLPAFQATRSSVIQAARGDFGQEYRPSRLRNVLVVIQITACVMLLIMAGVTLRSVRLMTDRILATQGRDVLHISVFEKSRALVLKQLAADPIVRGVAADWPQPAVQVTAEGAPHPEATSHDRTSPEYFSLLDLPVMRGRNFTVEEAASNAAVVIVTPILAERLWPDADPLGRSLQVIDHEEAPLAPTLTVIGLVPDRSVREGMGHIYTPTSTTEKDTGLLARVAGDPERARQRIDNSLETLAPGGAVANIETLKTMTDRGLIPFRAMAWIASGLAALALLLTMSGIYGVLAYLVAQRKKELGIRMALGASAGGVALLVMNQSLRLTVIGLAVGMPIALGVARVINSFESDLDEFFKAYDPVVYGGAALVALAACIAASYIPSRRAAGVDPAITLRHD